MFFLNPNLQGLKQNQFLIDETQHLCYFTAGFVCKLR